MNQSLFFILITLLGWCSDAAAYIDPGTSGYIFSLLGYLLSVISGIFLFFFRPLRDLIVSLLRKIRARPGISLVVLGVIAGGIIILAIGRYHTIKTERSSMQAKRYERVIVLGMDGMDPELLSRWMKEGRLPNFSRLKEMGGFATLQTSNPAQSPVAWSTLATGSNPGVFNIFDFIHRDPATYQPELSMLKEAKRGKLLLGETKYLSPRAGKTFWDIVREAGFPTTVIRWPLTFPPDGTSGKMLAGLGVPDVRGNLGRYTFYTTAPPVEDAEGQDKVVVVERRGDEIETELLGPLVAGLRGKKQVRTPFRIHIDANDRTAILQIHGKEMTIREKGWSPWTEVSFKIDFVRKVKAICQFYLAQIDSPFELYCTAMEVDPLDPVFPITRPPEYAKELYDQIGCYHTLGMPEDTKALNEGRMSEEAFLEQCRSIIAEREKMLMVELERFDQGLLAVVFDTPDRVQHMFWHMIDPKHPRYDTTSVHRNAIRDVYEEMDRILGEVMKRLRDGTTLIVLSDHGFASFSRVLELNRWLIDHGWMRIESGFARDGEASLLFKGVNWRETRAYALGFGSLYLNLQGREVTGIVGAEEIKRIKQELIEGIEELKDPETGERVIERVYDAATIYRGTYANNGPDLVVGLRPPYRFSWLTTIGGHGSSIFEENRKHWSGDHCVDPQYVPGIFLANRPFNLPNPRLVDVAPTILDCFGLERSAEMEGVSVF